MIVHKLPIVDVISYPVFVEPKNPRCEWAGAGTNAEKLAEYAGRVCYMSYHNPAGRTTDAYIRNILEQAHGSVLEHANVSVLIQGVSRSLTHELVRHRAGFAYSQLSQRYVDESDAAVVMPPAIQAASKKLRDAWVKSMLEAVEEYRTLVIALADTYRDEENPTLRRKKAREAARSVLPNATETKIVVTANLRSWRHFLELRGGAGADAEIRNLAIMLLAALQPIAPSVFQDLQVQNGCIVSSYHKV